MNQKKTWSSMGDESDKFSVSWTDQKSNEEFIKE